MVPWFVTAVLALVPGGSWGPSAQNLGAVVAELAGLTDENDKTGHGRPSLCEFVHYILLVKTAAFGPPLVIFQQVGCVKALRRRTGPPGEARCVGAEP